ncbi:MAG: class I SAM-dependent methyltransferase [Planctomycetota bacterium]
MGETSEYIHDGSFYDEINRFDSDLPFWRRQCGEAGGAVLELACGTGRLTIPLAQEGIDIEGVDVSASMLARARAKADEVGAAIRFTEGNMLDLDLGRRFALVFIPFNSLQCIEEVGDVGRVFDTARRHLAPGGRFVFDVFNPSIQYMTERAEGWHPMREYTDAEGCAVVVTEQCRYDAARQLNGVTWKIKRGGEVRTEQLEMRCFFPRELDALIRLFGFRRRALYGDYDESPFTSASPKQISVCEPGDSPRQGP